MRAKRTAVKTRTGAQAKKIDLYADHSSEYAAPKTPVIVETSKAHYLATDISRMFQRRTGADGC